MIRSKLRNKFLKNSTKETGCISVKKRKEKKKMLCKNITDNKKFWQTIKSSKLEKIKSREEILCLKTIKWFQMLLK